MLDIINLSFKLPLPEDHILLAWWRRTGPAMVGQKEIFISPVEVLCGAVYAWVLVRKGFNGHVEVVYLQQRKY